MKIFKTILGFLCMTSLCCVLSCKSGGSDTDSNGIKSNNSSSTDSNAIAVSKMNNEPGADNKYYSGLRLKKGDKYYYTLKASIATNLEINEKKIETNNETEVGLRYEVVNDSANTFLLKITYDKLHLHLNKTDTEDQDFDANNAAETQDPMDKLLSDIKGGSLLILLNDKGDVLRATGSQEIMDKIMKPMATESLEAKKKVGDFVTKLTGQAFINENMKDGFKILPAGGVKEGDSWNKKSTQSAELTFDVNSTYTLSSLDDGIAEITVEGAIDNLKDAKTRFMGYDVTTNLSGSQSGKFKADISSGLVIYSKTNTSISGEIQLLQRNVPVTIKVKKEAQAKKM
jgi:Family of unknown function (DUF6263)